MENLKIKIDGDIVKKILGNTDTIKTYLGKMRVPYHNGLSANDYRKLVVDTWQYDKSKDIIRELFKSTTKYRNGKSADDAMQILLREWESLQLGDVSWPFSQGDFDGFVQRINSGDENGTTKDNAVKSAAVKYRRLKEINTVRNDYIETLIFNKNKNIIPTLSHRQGVDFYINGISFDQKVARSPTKKFQKDYGAGWRDFAKRNPEIVAKYLYEGQDEGRFGKDPRLLVVYLDENIPIENIRGIIEQTDLDSPIEISFTYNHKIHGEKHYKVQCYVI
ncbi:MAG: hypothetical protein LBJ18_03265, partial [Rickettsiales bacterium]|nr:hypothetical protein [Rickettsiales bacterium]